MAGLTPFFLTGANAKILLNNKTLAFATDMSYTITVRHASPRLLGKYEVETHMPLTYDVTGSFTIIRYARGLMKYLGGNVPQGVLNEGSGVGSWGMDSRGSLKAKLGLPDSSGNFDGRADEAFNPSRLFQSMTFTIEIRQKIPSSSSVNKKTHWRNIGEFVSDVGQAVNNKLDPQLESIDRAKSEETTIALIRGCRIEEGQFVVGKHGVATQRFTFKATMVDDDTYTARRSGVGQEFS